MKREEWRRAYEPLPDSLAVRVERTLSQLEEERIVKKHVLRTVIIVCVLVLLLGGTALAMARQFGVGDFLGWMYGEELKPGAQELVDYPQASKRVGDVTVTVREAIWDGFAGHLVIEYRSPEGTAMVPWDDRRIEGKAEDEQALLDTYGVYYAPLDPDLLCVTDKGSETFWDELGFYYRQEADDVLSMILSFSCTQMKSTRLSFGAGAHKFTKGQEDERTDEWLEFDVTDHTLKNHTFTFERPGELNGKEIDRVTFTFTPLQTVVDIDFADGARTYTGIDVLVLDEAGNAVEPTSTSLLSNGVDAFDELPQRIGLQAASNGEPIGEVLILSFE